MDAALLCRNIPSDPTGWLVSEKYDGVRAIWNGEEFLTRSGNVLNSPQWFRDGMPDARIDGELWMGRGTFGELNGTLRRRDNGWSGVKFMAFETADMHLAVEERISILGRLNLPGHCIPVQHVICADRAHLDLMEREVVAGGGEGLVIRRPGSMYRPGRAGDVIKIKRLVEDRQRWQG